MSISVPLLIAVYCLLTVAASLIGGRLPSLIRLTHTRMQLMLSFVGGLMLGVALYHLLPHAEIPLERVVWWTMVGLLATFLLIRTFHFHQHGPIEELPGTEHSAAGDSGGAPSRADGDHSYEGHAHEGHDTPAHPYSWVGVAIGLSLHTMIDGVAVAASVVAESEGVSQFALFGFGTFLVVLLHKPLDSLSITAVMAAGGWSTRALQLVNAGYAMMAPLGAAVFYVSYVGLQHSSGAQPAIVGCALAFCAGVFLCISLADLLPEVQFHTHDRWKLSAALLLGVAVAYGIRFLEPPHVHHRGEPPAPATAPHEH